MHEPYWLKQGDLSFPDPVHALTEPNGLLAVGGDLAIDRLLNAYRSGIFLGMKPANLSCGGLQTPHGITSGWCMYPEA